MPKPHLRRPTNSPERQRGAMKRKRDAAVREDVIGSVASAKRAFSETMGNVAALAARMGVAQRTLRRWINLRGLRSDLVRARSVSKVTAQVETDCGLEHISIVDGAGNMATISFPRRSEALKLMGLLGREGARCEDVSIVAQIQVSSAAERARASKLEMAMRRIAGPEISARVMEEVSDGG